MVSLKTVTERSLIKFQVIDGGSGTILGTLSETDQTTQPSYVFVQPRHLLRTPPKTALKPGMVIRAPSGLPFIVGLNGPSENRIGTLWQSFRLFEPTGRYRWQRRTKVRDAITKQDREGPLQDLGLVWAALEPLDREQSDREMRQNFEQMRIITGASVQPDDLLDNRRVTKLDRQLGLGIGVLT